MRRCQHLKKENCQILHDDFKTSSSPLHFFKAATQSNSDFPHFFHHLRCFPYFHLTTADADAHANVVRGQPGSSAIVSSLRNRRCAFDYKNFVFSREISARGNPRCGCQVCPRVRGRRAGGNNIFGGL